MSDQQIISTLNEIFKHYNAVIEGYREGIKNSIAEICDKYQDPDGAMHNMVARHCIDIVIRNIGQPAENILQPGTWIKTATTSKGQKFKCSICGGECNCITYGCAGKGVNYCDYEYCPRCGAAMGSEYGRR